MVSLHAFFKVHFLPHRLGLERLHWAIGTAQRTVRTIQRNSRLPVHMATGYVINEVVSVLETRPLIATLRIVANANHADEFVVSPHYEPRLVHISEHFLQRHMDILDVVLEVFESLKLQSGISAIAPFASRNRLYVSRHSNAIEPEVLAECYPELLVRVHLHVLIVVLGPIPMHDRITQKSLIHEGLLADSASPSLHSIGVRKLLGGHGGDLDSALVLLIW